MTLSLTNIALIGAGSCLGGITRYIISRLIGSTASAFPLGTLTVNILGCFILGLVCGLAERYGNMSVGLRLFLTIGFCGGFTTFSTFINENFTMTSHDALPLQAIIYTVISLAGGFIMLYTGYRIGRI